jgi:hypothetical protein
MSEAIVKLGVIFLGSENIEKEKHFYIFWLSRDIHYLKTYARLNNHLLAHGRMVDMLKSDLILYGAKDVCRPQRLITRVECNRKEDRLMKGPFSSSCGSISNNIVLPVQ